MPDTTDETTTATTEELDSQATEEAPQDEQASEEQTTEETDEQPEEKDEDESSKLSHEDALAALKKVRTEAAGHRTKLRELEKRLADLKTPEQVEELVTTMKNEREQAERALLVENVALKFGLPPELSTRLQGATREELEADAKALSKYATQERDIDPDRLGGGLDPSDEDGSFDPVKAAREARRRRY